MKMWTEKMERRFYKWYMDTYKDYLVMGEDGRYQLPIIISDDPKATAEEHEKLWKWKLSKLMGVRKCRQTYKIRNYGPQSWLSKVFSDLWLCYGPVFK